MKCGPVDLLHCVAAHPGENQRFYRAMVAEAVGCSESAVQTALKYCIGKCFIRFTETGNQKLYALSLKGSEEAANTSSSYDWHGRRTETI